MTTDQHLDAIEARLDAAGPGWYYRAAGRWVRVEDPRQAPKGLRVWAADELHVLPSGELAVRPAQETNR